MRGPQPQDAHRSNSSREIVLSISGSSRRAIVFAREAATKFRGRGQFSIRNVATAAVLYIRSAALYCSPEIALFVGIYTLVRARGSSRRRRGAAGKSIFRRTWRFKEWLCLVAGRGRAMGEKFCDCRGSIDSGKCLLSIERGGGAVLFACCRAVMIDGLVCIGLFRVLVLNWSVVVLVDLMIFVSMNSSG